MTHKARHKRGNLVFSSESALNLSDTRSVRTLWQCYVLRCNSLNWSRHLKPTSKSSSDFASSKFIPDSSSIRFRSSALVIPIKFATLLRHDLAWEYLCSIGCLISSTILLCVLKLLIVKKHNILFIGPYKLSYLVRQIKLTRYQ